MVFLRHLVVGGYVCEVKCCQFAANDFAPIFINKSFKKRNATEESDVYFLGFHG